MTTSRSSHYTREQEQQLVLDNLALVAHLAKKFSPKPHDLQDYIQAGSIGLLRAIRKHDPALGKLTTFAFAPIKWEILRHMKKHSRHDEPLDGICVLYEEQDDPFWSYIPDSITDEERKIVTWRTEGFSFREIGEKLGYTRTRSSKIYREAALKMKRAVHEEASSICN